jgi:hypothetical protein
MDEVIILFRQDLRAAMRFGDYVKAVADGFRLFAEGRYASPVPTQIDVAHGAFHLKPASLPRGPGYVAVKVNGNFPDNRARPSSATCCESEEMGYAPALFAPARKYEFDLARALIDEGDLLLDNDIAKSAQLRRQSLRFGGQRMKFDVRGDNTVNRNRKGAAGKRRHLLRDQLRDLYLLIHREKVGLRGGGLGGRLCRGCRNDEA